MSAQTVAAVHTAWCGEHVDDGAEVVMCRRETGVVATMSHTHPLHVVAAHWDNQADSDVPGDDGGPEMLVEISPDGRWMNYSDELMDVVSLQPADARALAAALVAAADLLEPPASAGASRGQARGRRGGAR